MLIWQKGSTGMFEMKIKTFANVQFIVNKAINDNTIVLCYVLFDINFLNISTYWLPIWRGRYFTSYFLKCSLCSSMSFCISLCDGSEQSPAIKCANHSLCTSDIGCNDPYTVGNPKISGYENSKSLSTYKGNAMN